MAVELYKTTDPTYVRERIHRFAWENREKLAVSGTLYVGNLSFYTSEEQIYELFSKVGEIKRIIMGLNSQTKTPCGFCFVEYYTHQDALDAVSYINQTKLDDRVIRLEMDPGWYEGRQYGKGKSGGQVRDEFRSDYDPGRGGYGRIYEQEGREKKRYRDRDEDSGRDYKKVKDEEEEVKNQRFREDSSSESDN